MHIGKILQEECKYIFESSSNKKHSDVDSIGFILLSVVLNNSRKKMDKLSDCFNKNSSKDLIQLKDKIVNCSKQVEKILQNFIVMPNNKTFFYRYRETLIICMIATMFKIMYANKGSSISFIQRTDSKKELELFKKNMSLRFLFDIITEHWNSSSDKNLEEELKFYLLH